jgi:preprotein translocase subunit SecG
MWLLVSILLIFHVAVCLLLVLVVLMQLPRSEGLGAAFGGAVTENIFGAQTTNVLAKFTVWLGVAFFALTLLLAVAYAKADSVKASKVQKELMAAPVPAESAPASAATPAPMSSPASSPEAVTVPAGTLVPAASPVMAPEPAASAVDAFQPAPSASPTAVAP